MGKVGDGSMSEFQFGGPPRNGAQVVMTNSGSSITPYRVTVTVDGELLKDETFTLKRDAERFRNEQMTELQAARS